ncbi:MAG: hypothetical protein HRT74_00190 [Flavobacteriales bacterium]|nr:hypothetical protein [Flavobacteriales bacterium]
MRLFLFVLGVIASCCSIAQSRFDVFHVSGNQNFNAPTDSIYEGNDEFAITSNLSVPLFLKDSCIWFTSLDYQYFNIGNSATIDAPRSSYSMHGFVLRTGYIHRFDANRSLQFLLVPRLMSDLKGSFTNGFQLGGIVLYEKKRSKDFTWRVGALFNQEFFGPQLVPLVYLDGKVKGRWRVKGLFPIYGKLYYQKNEKVSAGLHFVGLSTSYAISDDLLGDQYMDRRVIDASLFVRIQMWKDLFLEARFGYSISKDYGLYERGDEMSLAMPLTNIGDDRNRLNLDTRGESPFAFLRLVYSVKP